MIMVCWNIQGTADYGSKYFIQNIAFISCPIMGKTELGNEMSVSSVSHHSLYIHTLRHETSPAVYDTRRRYDE